MLTTTLNNKSRQTGFTLMEIVVSTAIFAGVLTVMLTLFNYTLRINRRAEALRQTTQAVRNLTEYFIKEVRNGKIDYASSDKICADTYGDAGGSTNFVAIINIDGSTECFYSDSNILYLIKDHGTAQAINPSPTNANTQPTITIDSSSFKFFVRPTSDPYTKSPRRQPSITIVALFTVRLPTGESFSIPYQTTISTRVYDLPQ